MKKPDLNLDALRIEGSLLPAEFIQKLLELSAEHQAASDYGVPPGLSLKDEIGRYWRIATALWSDFNARCNRAGADPEKLTQSHWLVPLFTRVLGYENWTAIPGENIGERRFPLTHKLGVTPILLAPRTIDIDRGDTRFAPEGRRRSAHSTLQEYLNANEHAQWGIVTNGNVLRILRDNPSLTRPAYIEADLSRIFTEERYADFVALWLLVHATRFGDSDAKHSDQPPILERWHGQAQVTGERALENLRDGVTDALRQLGNGFIAHPSNTALRAALSEDRLSTEEYFKQLLRLVYRLILLYTAEDRGLLHSPSATPIQREIYAKGYSADLLRERALRGRRDRHADLWQGVLVTVRGLATGATPLGLPALGGLFATDKCPDLDTAELPNNALLGAIRALCFFRSGAVLARINYRDMDTEELGSVYESLLELQPTINVDANPWIFSFVGDDAQGDTRGSARKLTGSYYTPDSLVQELIKSALEPKIDEALKQPDPRSALLSLKVVDPASGSGHFLLAAARRIAAEIARIDAASDIPEAQAFRLALREVVARCIYGVDLNPLAVELCKTALWLETLEPGKPLGFLDHHIRHGNSLIGILDPSIMQEGIPDEAYTALSGDDKTVCTALKKSNRAQAGGRQAGLFGSDASSETASAHAVLDLMPEDTVEAIEAKRAAFESAEADDNLARERLRGDLFCAAFFAPKTELNRLFVPLSGDLNQAADGQPVRPGVAELTQRLSAEHHFFHWRLAFPEVFAKGGFDVVLANPPWERIKLQEQEFFGPRHPAIATAANAAARTRLIEALNAANASPADKRLYRDFLSAKRGAEGTSLFAHDSERFPLTGTGDTNLYAVFAETISEVVADSGKAGFIVPSGLATEATTMVLFKSLLASCRLHSFFELENYGFFPGAGQRHMLRFALITINGVNEPSSAAKFIFQGRKSSDLRDSRRLLQFSAADLEIFNPNTQTCPVFLTAVDFQIAKEIYQRIPILIRESNPSLSQSSEVNSWGVRFQAMFHMASDSGLFITREDAETLPVYEAKMFHLFDHRWASYEQSSSECIRVPEESKANARYQIKPKYWVKKSVVDERVPSSRRWLITFRDINNSANARLLVSTIIPRAAVGHSAMVVSTNREGRENCLLAANLSALVLEFVLRQKMSGTHLSLYIMKQLPILPPNRYAPADLDFIVPRVLELTYTAHDLAPFARDLGYDGPPYAWNTERRALLRAELDAYYANLYGLSRDELRYVLDPADIYGDDYPSETFRVLKNNEIRQFGEYRTQRLVLDAWDRLTST